MKQNGCARILTSTSFPSWSFDGSMIFRCTGRTRRRLGLSPSDLVPLAFKPSVREWHCNVIMLARRPFFLFAHSLSLFGFLMVAAGHSSQKDFAQTFRRHALGLLGNEGISPDVAHKSIDYGPDFFSKATDRGVLGSMVDFANMSRFVVEDDG